MSQHTTKEKEALKKVVIDGQEYWYSGKTGTLYFDKRCRKQLPLACFNNYQYSNFLSQIQLKTIL